MPLFWRLFAFNASILVLIAVLLIVSPVTISSPIHLTEAAIVWAGLIVTLAANFVLLRRALVPLDRLAEPLDDAIQRPVGWPSEWRSSICSDPDSGCRPGAALWGA